LLSDRAIAILYWIQYGGTPPRLLPVKVEGFNYSLSVKVEGLGVRFRVHIALK
jgi:hypothetical protein